MFPVKSYDLTSPPLDNNCATPDSRSILLQCANDIQGMKDDNSHNNEDSSMMYSIHHTPIFLEQNQIIILEPLYAEPIFTEIFHGSLSLKDYMLVEPVFESIGDVRLSPDKKSDSNSNKNEMCMTNIPKKPLVSNPSTIYPVSKSLSVYICAENTDRDAIDAVYNVTDVQNNVGVVDFSECLSTNDVTVYPQEISSFSNCLYFISHRSKRLKLLRDTAIWRSVGLLCGWLFTILFVFCYHHIFPSLAFQRILLSFS